MTESKSLDGLATTVGSMYQKTGQAIHRRRTKRKVVSRVMDGTTKVEGPWTWTLRPEETEATDLFFHAVQFVCAWVPLHLGKSRWRAFPRALMIECRRRSFCLIGAS